jgi:hypothetical protein
VNVGAGARRKGGTGASSLNGAASRAYPAGPTAGAGTSDAGDAGGGPDAGPTAGAGTSDAGDAAGGPDAGEAGDVGDAGDAGEVVAARDALDAGDAREPSEAGVEWRACALLSTTKSDGTSVDCSFEDVRAVGVATGSRRMEAFTSGRGAKRATSS